MGCTRIFKSLDPSMRRTGCLACVLKTSPSVFAPQILRPESPRLTESATEPGRMIPCRYRRGEPISGWMITFASAPLNSVISPTFLPGTGSNRAAKGLFHLNASVATSPTIRAMASSLVSPASGTVPALGFASPPPGHRREFQPSRRSCLRGRPVRRSRPHCRS